MDGCGSPGYRSSRRRYQPACFPSLQIGFKTHLPVLLVDVCFLFLRGLIGTHGDDSIFEEDAKMICQICIHVHVFRFPSSSESFWNSNSGNAMEQLLYNWSRCYRITLLPCSLLFHLEDPED